MMTSGAESGDGHELLEQVRQTQVAQGEQLDLLSKQLGEVKKLLEETLDWVKSIG